MNQFTKGGVSQKNLAAFAKKVEKSPIAQVVKNALHKLPLNDVALSADGLASQSFVFSTDIKTMASTNQKASGRCWLFAATNCLREMIAKERKLEDFELSQSWLAFWDKFERANFFLESIIATAALPLTDRVVHYILHTGVTDGGQWDMFVNIVNKYGICPKSAFGETYQSSNSRPMNLLLNWSLKHDAVALRKMIAAGASKADVKAAKESMMAEVYGFLTSCYGTPVKQFDFEYRNKEGRYVREAGHTPKSFKEKFFGDRLNDYVSIIHAPTADKPFGKTFTVDFLGNVAEASPLKYLNLSMDDFKDAVLKQLQDGEIVWFGSDCGKLSERGEKNLFDPAAFEFGMISGLSLEMTKAEMLDYGFSAMNHAMVITGVNVVDGKPTRWKIENSWGTDGPNKGYYFMSDEWFDSFVFQAVVQKKYLGKKAALVEQDPVILKPWDPMGTLAD